MITVNQLAAFALASFVIIVIPGPSVLFVIGRALAHGRRTALASVFGNAVGVYVVAAAVAIGLGTLVQRSQVVFTGLKIAGAVYLCWLGIQAIRHRRALGSALDSLVVERGTLQSAWEGFVVGVANPKVFILFAAVLPQFVNRSSGHVPAQMLLLGLVSFVIAVVCDSLWAIMAGTVRSWLASSPRRLNLIGGTGGVAMIGVGLTVALTGRKD